MPLYDYICGSCGQRTEVMHSVHGHGPETCPACGKGPMKKALTPPAIHFKGTGWAKKERAGASVPKAAGSRPGDAAAGEAAQAAKPDKERPGAAADGSAGSSGTGPAPAAPASTGGTEG